MQKENLKILFISSWYPTRINTTNGNFVFRHANAIANYGTVGIVHVAIDPNLRKKKEVVISKKDNVYEIIIYVKNVQRIFLLGYFIKVIRIFLAYLLGHKLFTREIGTPNIVHANVIFPIGIIARVYSLIYGIPYLITEHWTGYMDEFPIKISWIQLIFIKRISKKSKYICPVSNDLQAGMEKKGITGNYKVVPNVVDISLFYPENMNSIDINIKKIIHISSLNDEQKNISGIIQSIHKLTEKRSDFEFHIIHDFEAQNFIQITEDFGLLNKYIFFHGQKSIEEVAGFLRTCHFMVIFSNYETFSIVTVESFASGLPVIGTNIGALREHITPKRGLLVAPGDIEDLTNKIDYMLDHFQDFQQNNLVQYAQQFGVYNVGKIYFSLYKKILNQTN